MHSEFDGTRLDLAIPTIAPEAWCHPNCYTRWAALPLPRQGMLGGHIHYDEAIEAWTVPFVVPMRGVGVYEHRVIRLLS